MILLVFFCVCSFLKFTDSELPLEYCTELINYDILYKECLQNAKTIPLSYKTRCKEYKKDGQDCEKLFKHISKVTTTTSKRYIKRRNLQDLKHSKQKQRESHTRPKHQQRRLKSSKNDNSFSKNKKTYNPNEKYLEIMDKCLKKKYTISFIKCLKDNGFSALS
ncbi:uncharacterized protein LOC26528804 [Drosophila willistoni]|uniref:uncharacterized protein LOC26528804 n=1 Tax=Drosophila willistoni TaxID=7260 RepID=UPI000C26CDF3|nr:uncharacterized protein LOC26528804 [Drosophila willistoni]